MAQQKNELNIPTMLIGGQNKQGASDKNTNNKHQHFSIGKNDENHLHFT